MNDILRKMTDFVMNGDGNFLKAEDAIYPELAGLRFYDEPVIGCADGKDHTICGPYVEMHSLPPHGPNQRIRYGCGKCQVKVSCECGIPGKK